MLQSFPSYGRLSAAHGERKVSQRVGRVSRDGEELENRLWGASLTITGAGREA